MAYTIFLDVDGVLNQLQPWYIDDNCVSRLQQICNNLNSTNIVLTSSWRKGFSRIENQCTPQVKALVDKLNKAKLNLIGRTRDLGDRQEEVIDYCTRYNINKYIILDDDKSEFKSSQNLYPVNSRTGLTDRDVKQIKKLYK